ncbi:MAG: serine/threonine protein kinase [Deltaproteobacteria bacterium]|nr:serine/threonine protein kinase [Deltaproteobacteria bacterium]
MECLDANVVQDLMADALSVERKAAAIQHLDGCGDCRDLLGALARDATRDAALDTLNDTAKQPVRPSTMETLGSQAGALLETVPPEHASATAPVRIRPSYVAMGTSLGRYTLFERLGAGAMGVVYRATDRELGRDVALKQLHRPNEELTDRLVREARSMAQVNHPNVVAVYDVGTADGVTYIAMEMVAGESLRTWQRASRTVRQIVEAYVSAGRGLAAAHAAGIVHRDFKPDNVLVGHDGRVRVTDFGLAASRVTEGGGRSPLTTMMSDVNLTTSGSVLGTPAYMAPEQFTGGNVDARTDQFNFAVALYEALYGQRPFEGKTFAELSDNVCEGRLRPPPPGARISRGLHEIIMRGLSVKPGDRYPTMEHMLVELGRDRARPWRRTASVATALAVLLALGLGADWIVRDRVSAQIGQSFTATATQSDRAVELVSAQFLAISNLVYLFPIMRDVATHHDEADFGLGAPEDDAQALEALHDQLVSADWRLARVFGGEQTSILALADYKARLLYSSAAPGTWKTDLSKLPWIKQAFDAGAGNTMTLLRYDEPHLVATGILGNAQRTGLAMLFTRTLALGETRSHFLQILDAGRLLDQIRLDDTMLSIVAADGTSVGDVPPEVVKAAPAIGQSTITLDGTTYAVQSLPLTGFAGRLVMGQRIDSVLTLFPGARVVFLIAMLAALAAAIGTAVLARRITGARVA